jgi:hypothetical protein
MMAHQRKADAGHDAESIQQWRLILWRERAQPDDLPAERAGRQQGKDARYRDMPIVALRCLVRPGDERPGGRLVGPAGGSRGAIWGMLFGLLFLNPLAPQTAMAHRFDQGLGAEKHGKDCLET